LKTQKTSETTPQSLKKKKKRLEKTPKNKSKEDQFSNPVLKRQKPHSGPIHPTRRKNQANPFKKREATEPIK